METMINLFSRKAINKVTLIKTNPIQQACKAFMAGVYISLGALFMLVVKCDSTLSPAISAILSGLVFSIGLIFVIMCDGELFTGNCLMFIGLLRKQITNKELSGLLSYTLLWNTFGCLFIAILTKMSGINTDIFKAIMYSKIVNTSLLHTFGKAIFCNILVCLAVWGSTKHNQKTILIIMPVSMFVACGFEHSIADIFYCIFIKTNPNTLMFLFVVIIGNILGGFFLSWLLKNSYE